MFNIHRILMRENKDENSIASNFVLEFCYPLYQEDYRGREASIKSPTYRDLILFFMYSVYMGLYCG